MTGGGALEAAEAGAFADAVEAERVGVGADRCERAALVEIEEGILVGIVRRDDKRAAHGDDCETAVRARRSPRRRPTGGTEIVSARAIEAASAVAMAITIERARTARNPVDALGRD